MDRRIDGGHGPSREERTHHLQQHGLGWLIEKLPAVKAHEVLQQALELNPRAEPSSEQVSWHVGLLPLSPDSGVLKVFRRLCGFSTPEIYPRVAFSSLVP